MRREGQSPPPPGGGKRESRPVAGLNGYCCPGGGLRDCGSDHGRDARSVAYCVAS